MPPNIEKIILANLITNEPFARAVLPYLKADYFSTAAEKIIFANIENFLSKYKTLPTKSSLNIEIDRNKNLTEAITKSIQSTLNSLDNVESGLNLDWLIDASEAFAKKQSLELAIQSSLAIFSGEDKNNDWGAIPDILTKALAVSFDNSVGHSYFDDAEARYEYYHEKTEKIPFKIDWLNEITQHGVGKKTLNLIIGPTHGGKSLTLCSLAADYISLGKNVLYVTLEMSEKEISKRVDANLFDVTVNNILNLTKSQYLNTLNKLKQKTHGQLIVKEFPTAGIDSRHIRNLLDELKLKLKFIPDVICVDYLNNMLSARIKASAAGNSYNYIKCISEELRGVAVDYNLPIWTATQFNRTGSVMEDPGMTDVSESFGINFVADFTLAIVSTPEMIASDKILFKQLKNRYGNMNDSPSKALTCIRAKMQICD